MQLHVLSTKTSIWLLFKNEFLFRTTLNARGLQKTRFRQFIKFTISYVWFLIVPQMFCRFSSCIYLLKESNYFFALRILRIILLLGRDNGIGLCLIVDEYKLLISYLCLLRTSKPWIHLVKDLLFPYCNIILLSLFRTSSIFRLANKSEIYSQRVP